MDHPKQTRGWGIYYSLTVDGDYSTGERSTLHCMSTFFLFIPRLIQAIVLKNEILSCGHGSVSGTAFMRCQVAKLNPTLRLKPEKNWKTKTRRNFFLSKHKKVHTEIPTLNPLKCKFFTTGKKVITPPRRSKSPVLFFLVGYAILKDLFILVWREIHRRKFYRWRHDNWPIGQWVIFHAAPDIACQSLFPAWIYNVIPIHSGETSRSRDFVGSPVAARPHALMLASLTFNNLWEVDL